MRKIFTLIAASMVSFAISAEAYVTAGDATVYTFADLAKIPESGVTVKKNTQTYTVANNIEIAATDGLVLEDGDVIKLGDAVEIVIYGDADFTPRSWALITRTDDTVTPKGLYIRDNGNIEMRNVVIEYAQVRSFATTSHWFENCTFRYCQTKGSSTGAIAINNSTESTEPTGVINCRFIECVSAAIGQGATTSHPMVIQNCYFYHNDTSNANRPQINITNPGKSGHIIMGNMIIGATETKKSGGIAISDLVGSNGGGIAIVQNNTIFNCRYGLTFQSASSIEASIKDNSLTYNCNETNANNGGSGISIYGKVKVYGEGNLIEGNLWGVTILGASEGVNFGKIDDPTAEDYNPGRNIFKSNGNGGTDYDFYNNSSNAITCYAQGNVWNVAEQDSVSVSKVVWDKYDNAALGEVIFTMPSAASSNVASITQTSNDFTYDAAACEVKATVAAPITVYSMSGVVAKMSSSPVAALKVDELVAGVYVARNESTGHTVKFAKE